MVDRFIREVALVPSVCNPDTYASEVEREALAGIAGVGCQPPTFVRDLRLGEWRRAALEAADSVASRWRVLLLQWAKSGCLLACQPALSASCSSADDWEQEAAASHAIRPLALVVRSAGCVSDATQVPPRFSITHVADSELWGGVRSIDLPRTTDGWADLLRKVLAISSWVAFVDPHLDPVSPGYRGFATLLRDAARGLPRRSIEFHRWSRLSERQRGQSVQSQPSLAEWEYRFRVNWQSALNEANIHATVALWPDLRDAHDRFILTRPLGLHCGNGFDIPVRRSGRVRTLAVTCLSAEHLQSKCSELSLSAHRDEGPMTFEFGAPARKET